MTIRLLLLPGDGIGPEIAAATRGVLETADRTYGLGLEFETEAIGFESLAREGTTLPDRVLERARAREHSTCHFPSGARHNGRRNPL